MQPAILGIVNVTRDSFSDGGRFLDPAAAIAHGRRLHADGADVIDLGAESTHPEAEDVSAAEEIARLEPVITALKSEGLVVSVDTHKPAVMRRMLELGADFINDVTALRDPCAVDAVRDSDSRLILMHSRSSGARAERRDADPLRITDEILEFFGRRIESLHAAGIGRERLILDPGMGLFLSRSADASLAVLRELPRLRALGCSVLVSVSRKSFLGEVLGGPGGPRAVGERAAGTLAAELWAAASGVDYIRTHDVRALRDGLAVWRAIGGGR